MARITRLLDLSWQWEGSMCGYQILAATLTLIDMSSTIRPIVDTGSFPLMRWPSMTCPPSSPTSSESRITSKSAMWAIRKGLWSLSLFSPLSPNIPTYSFPWSPWPPWLTWPGSNRRSKSWPLLNPCSWLLVDLSFPWLIRPYTIWRIIFAITSPLTNGSARMPSFYYAALTPPIWIRTWCPTICTTFQRELRPGLWFTMPNCSDLKNFKCSTLDRVEICSDTIR